MPKALAVVAHHDDHILWMGGTIQRMKAAGWDWMLIAMCVPDDPRRPYYRSCCNALGVNGHWMDFGDYQGPAAFSVNKRADMEASLLAAVGGTAFDYVFTHSRDQNGEYGFHANHAEVAQVVHALVQQINLCRSVQDLAYFSYALMYGGNGKATVARTDASYYLQLTYPELLLKADWSGRAPDVSSSLLNLGFPCPNPEAFEGDGLVLPGSFIRGDHAKS